MINKIKEIYHYRTMISSLIQRELFGKYKGSILGFAWTFLNPLLQLIVYTLVFSTIMKAGIEDYYLFLFVALVPWIFFSTSLTGGANCIWKQKELVKKIYFPREVLPIAHVTCQFANMLFSFIIVFGALILSGRGISFMLFPYLILIMGVEYLLALGMAFITSALAVYVRDLEHLLVNVALAWQFLTPIVYTAEMVPEQLRPILMINPMTPVILAYRSVLYEGRIPELTTLLWALVLGVVLLFVGWIIFGRLEKHFAEEL